MITSDDSKSNSKHRAEGAADGRTSGNEDRSRLLYDAAVQVGIKQLVKVTWERKRAIQGMNQSGFAAALGVNQPAISRLLNRDYTHPWTVAHLVAASKYLGVNLQDLLPHEFRKKLLPLFRPYISDKGADIAFLRECMDLVKAFAAQSGISVDENIKELGRIAGKLAESLDARDIVDLASMQRERDRLLVELAIKYMKVDK